MSETIPPTTAATDPTSPAPKKKRRLWLKVILALIVIVILLIACAPMIISTGAVKSIVLGQVNKNLNGHIEIADWSIGWTSGVKVTGIRVFDEKNAQIAEVKSFSTQLSLLGAARGNLDLGETTIDSPNGDLYLYRDGTSNFSKLVKQSPSEPKPPKSEPSPSTPKEDAKLPDVKVKFKVVNGSFKVQREGDPNVLAGKDLNITTTITDINQPIDHSLAVSLKNGNQEAGTISVSGKASAIKANKVDLDTADVNETIALNNIDLPALSALIPPSAGIAIKSGQTGGTFTVAFAGGKKITLEGKYEGSNIRVTGAALKGDEYATQKFNVTVPPIVVDLRNGVSDINAIVAKAEQPVSITFDHGSATADINLQLSGIMNLAQNKAGSVGGIKLDVKADIGKLAAMLPHTFRVREGTDLTSGSFHQTVVLAMANEQATFTLTTDLTDVAGKNAGTVVSIKPVNLKLTGEVGPSSTKLPGLKNVVLDLTSGFATAHFTAPTLTQLKGNAKGEFAKVQSEAGQIIDFGKIKTDGTFAVDIDTKGDINDVTKPIDFGLVATITNVRIDGLADQPVTQPWLKATVNAAIYAKADNSIQSVKNIVATVKSNNEANPTIDLAAVSNVDLSNGMAVTYELQKLNVILGALQRELGPLVPALRDKPDLGLGTLAVTSSGSLTQSGENMAVTVTKLSATESKGLFSITQAGDVFVKMAGKNMTPGGKIKIDADLARLSGIAQQLSAGKATVEASANGQQLKSGTLSGTVELASIDATTNKITVDMKVDNLSVASKSGASEPQSVTFGLTTTPAADFSSIKIPTAYVKSAFANVDLNSVDVQLPKAAPKGAKGPSLPVVTSAKLVIDIPDFGPINTLMKSFMPPADPANPPIGIGTGSLKVVGDISREGTATILNISEVSGHGVHLQKGTIARRLKDFNIALAAKADITGDTSQTLADQFRSVSITKLGGNLGVAELSMPAPIVVTAPLGTMTAVGSIALSGEITELTIILESLAGKNPGELYPFTGKYTVTQNISSNGNTLTPKGTIEVDNFVVKDKAGATIVSEPKVTIANDVGIDLVTKSAKINALKVDMPASGALVLNVTGGVTDWETKRQIDNIVVKFAGDWDKLWPIARPLLSPEQQEQFKDLKISGKFDRTINASGSFPAGITQQEAIKLLSADGSVTIANVEWPSMGVTASNIEIPFTLKDGIVRLVYAGKPEDQNRPLADHRQHRPGIRIRFHG